VNRFSALLIAAAAALVAGDLMQAAPPAREPWVIPAFRARKKNPVSADATSLAAGKTFYTQQCESCHGTSGKGDGSAAKDLDVSPGDLTSAKMWENSDGALFWKMTDGRKPMQSFETLLTEEQRWNVVNYVRTLAPAPTAPAFAAPAAYRQAISGGLKPYFQMRTALASGDAKAAQDAAGPLAAAAGAIAALKGDDLDAKAKAAWADDAQKLSAAVAPLAAAKDLETLRSSFAAVSAAVIALVDHFGHAEGHPALLFRCTEASLKTPGEWLQDTGAGRSPYSGRSDAECAKPVKACGGSQGPPAS
jgi:mono/diheme cytochrome c family protein